MFIELKTFFLIFIYHLDIFVLAFIFFRQNPQKIVKRHSGIKNK